MKLNKEFWEQVLLDYEDYTRHDANGSKPVFLCGGSKLFKEVWDKQRDEIRFLAKEFLDYYVITNVELGLNLLFVQSSYSCEVAVETRKAFLNYLINERQEILD